MAIDVFENIPIENFRNKKPVGDVKNSQGETGVLYKFEVEEAEAGDLVAIAGLADISVGETICNTTDILPLPQLHIDEPTLQMTFGTNSSPFVGKDGKIVTARKIEERLMRETQKDVSLRVEPATNESFLVSGRGELHLSILIENMRREGFELEVSKPSVIIKEIDGQKFEPCEELQIEVPEDSVGTVIEQLGVRGGKMVSMTNFENQVRLLYTIPSRGLIGFSTDFMTLTKGYGIMNHTFKEYRPMLKMNVGERNVGVLVAVDSGQATPYAIKHVEERGTLFIEPGDDVYEGMIIGENRYETGIYYKDTPLTETKTVDREVTLVPSIEWNNNNEQGPQNNGTYSQDNIYNISIASSPVGIENDADVCDS